MKVHSTPVYTSRHDGLYMKYISPGKGRGVFCRDDIAAGSLLEIAPLLLISDTDTEPLKKTRLMDYFFEVPGLSADAARGSSLPIGSPLSGLVMGIASFCNHVAKANARYEIVEDGTSAYFYLYAQKDIPAGEEICVSYGAFWFALRNLSGGTANKDT